MGSIGRGRGGVLDVACLPCILFLFLCPSCSLTKLLPRLYPQALPKHLGGGSVLTVVRRLWEEGLYKSIIAGLSARVGTLSLQTAISFLFCTSINLITSCI